MLAINQALVGILMFNAHLAVFVRKACIVCALQVMSMRSGIIVKCILARLSIVDWILRVMSLLTMAMH